VDTDPIIWNASRATSYRCIIAVMLTSLLPGLRHFRTPFAVGALCAFQIWTLFGEWMPSRHEAHGFTKRVYELGEVAGRPVVTSLIAFALYLLGDIVKVSAERVARFIYSKRPSVRSSLLTHQSYHALHLYTETLRKPGDENFDLMGLMTAIMDEFPEVRMRLIANHVDVYLEQDRLESEAEFRVNVAIFSVSLWILLAIVWTPWSLFGLVASWVLFRNGLRALRGANAIIVQGLVAGIVESRTYVQAAHGPEAFRV
jgi:hypothetical protein